MTTEKLKIGLAQMTSVDQIEVNLNAVLSLYAESVAQGAELILFPENSLFFRIRSGSKLEAPRWDGPEFQSLQSAVDDGGAGLMLTTAMRSEDPPARKFKNATVLFEPKREPRLLYTKVHLFDVDVEGAPAVRESDSFEGGEGPALVEYRGWQLGLSICYDVRFAELYLNYAQQADLIVVPSAFLVPTGEAHWHTLLRARAIECQAYVAAPAQVGSHVSSPPGAEGQVRRTYGHALAVDPWGRILCDLGLKTCTQTLELTRAELNRTRRQIPMKGHRRLGR